MNLAWTIVIAILIFGLIIFIHELGHFATAKAVGIRVHEFALGMGPVLFRVKKGETQYAIRMFPIGGFVAMEGEEEDSEDTGAFCNKKVWQRTLVIVAGATMNILLGYVIMLIIVSNQNMVSTTVISEFDKDSASAQSLQVGDKILKVNNSVVHTANDIIFALVEAGDKPISMDILRKDEKQSLANVPFQLEKMEDGTPVVKLDFRVWGAKKTVGSVLRESWFMTTGVVKQVWSAFVKLVTGQFKVSQLSGPVGVTQAIGQVASTTNYSNLLMMIAFITINIGVFNLLPLPALDGGKLVFLLVEAVRGKPVPAKYEGFVHAAGLAFLMLVMVFVTFQDIVRIFKK